MLRFSDEEKDEKIPLKRLFVLGWRLGCLFLMAAWLPEFYAVYILPTYKYFFLSPLMNSLFKTYLPYGIFYGIFYLAAGGYAAKHFPKRPYLVAAMFLLLSLSWAVSPLDLMLAILGLNSSGLLTSIHPDSLQRLYPLPLLLVGVPARVWFESPKGRAFLRFVTSLMYIVPFTWIAYHSIDMEFYVMGGVGPFHPFYNQAKVHILKLVIMLVVVYSRSLVLLRGDRPIGRRKTQAVSLGGQP